MLTDADLAMLRTIVRDFLPQEAEVQRPTATSDGRGGQTLTFTTVKRRVPCRLAPSSGTEAVVAGRLTARESWTLTFLHDSDIRPQDRVVVGGHTFEVLAVLNAHAWTVATRVLAVEVAAT